MYYFNATPLQQQFQQPQVSAVENHDNLLAIFHAGGDCPSPEQTDREKQATYIAPGLDQSPAGAQSPLQSGGLSPSLHIGAPEKS